MTLYIISIRDTDFDMVLSTNVEESMEAALAYRSMVSEQLGYAERLDGIRVNITPWKI